MRIMNGVGRARRAFRLLKENPGLIPWALLPAIMTLVVSVAGIWLAVVYGDDCLNRFWPDPGEGALHWLWLATMSLIRVTSALLAVFITPWLVILLGTPLCEPLASRVDIILGGEEEAVPFLTGLIQSLRTAILVTGFGIGGSVLFFLLGLLPLVSLIVGPFVLLVWTPLFLCFDLQDGPLSRRNIELKQKVRLLMEQPLDAIGQGLVAMGLLAVPILNLVGLPIAVISGVISVRDHELSGKLEPVGTVQEP